MKNGLSVAIVGATGAVGQEFLRLFELREFPVDTLKLLASERSVGKTSLFKGEPYTVELAEKSSFEGVDVAFFSAGATRSRELVPAALAAPVFIFLKHISFDMSRKGLSAGADDSVGRATPAFSVRWHPAFHVRPYRNNACPSIIRATSRGFSHAIPRLGMS